MGEVYLARDSRLGRVVAIKLLSDAVAADPESRERFEREARSIAALSHPHICTLFDVGAEDAVSYLVMEFVEGPTLADCLREGPLDIASASRYGAQIAGALAAAHAQGVVHRDLKPANIKLSPVGAKVLDFGLAKVLTTKNPTPGALRSAMPDDPTLLATRRHTVLGTAPYMSPEQARGAPLDHRTDIWSLGVVLWEMLAGRRLFAGTTVADAMSAVLSAPIDLTALPAETPVEVRDLLARLLERNAERRLDDVAEAETVLLRSAAGRAAPIVVSAEASATTSRKSILVLPFTNSSSDVENEYFSDGLTEEIIADLSSIRALRVISRTTAMRLKGTSKDLAVLADELGFSYALEGSVRKAGSDLRITTQLVDARADQTLWAEKYRGTLEDVFAIQEQVSRSIVEALRVKLSAAEDRQLVAPSKSNAFAYDTYLRARREIWSFLPDRLARAEKELKHALSVVGDDVLLYSGLGMVNWQYVNAGISGDPRYLAEAERHARKVIELNPASSHGPRLLALVAQLRGDRVAWARHMQQAVAIDPHDPDQRVWLAICWTYAGRRSRARPIFEELLTTDPLFDMLMWGLGFDAHFSCEWRRAEGFYERGRQLAPEHPAGACVQAQIAASTGDLERMNRIIDEEDLDPASHPLAALTHIFKHSLLGQADAADALVSEDWEKSVWSDFQYTWIMAQAQAALGRCDEALRWLERATERGFIHYPFLSTGDPLLANLRGNPGFEALMARVEKRWRDFEDAVTAP